MELGALQNKRIVVGITGGIAAYKSIELIRLLKKSAAEVKVVLTDSAKEFVTPLTLQAISGNAVANSLLDPSAELAMGHIEIAKWAELIIIVPASADTISRLKAGMANDLLTTIILATDAPIILAPAMNQQMYAQSIVQENIKSLENRGMQIIGPNQGAQACGDTGFGRMSEPKEIYSAVEAYFISNKKLAGLTVAITAGPTREALDPVRYITNYSSGKMGYALASAFAELGANVVLISGPTQLKTPVNVKRIDVITTQEMWEEAQRKAISSDIFIGCAAVADYRLDKVATEKIKKSADKITLNLVKNPDIIADIANLKEHRPFTVGFAAETQTVADYAKDKLKRKNLDMICANDVSSKTQGFNSEQNALHVFWHKDEIQLPLANKLILARQLAELIYNQFKIQGTTNAEN